MNLSIFNVFGVSAFALLLITSSPVWAQDTEGTTGIEAIEEAYKAGDFATARAGLLPLAEAGNVQAQYRLGFMMASGSGGPFDQDGAKRWLESALAGGHQAGEVLLARIYLTGNPELPDYERAAELLEIGVAQNKAEAGYLLGELLRIGRGVEPDKDRAFSLLHAAAKADVADAQFAIAQMYSRGEGVSKDETQASRWLLEAAENGQSRAQMSLYFNYKRGTGFPQDDDVAMQWLHHAAAGGATLGQRILGSAYLLGEGVEADPAKGVELLLAAAQKEEPGAQSNLGYAYAKGLGVEQSDEISAQWYQKAADQGLTRAALVMGENYEIGRGVEPDVKQAIKYYEIAYLGRSEAATARLGHLLISGAIAPEDEPEAGISWVAAAARTGTEGALGWLEKRADSGEPFADFLIAQLFRDGTGVEADASVAAQHFLRAAQGDIRAAQEAISEIFAQGNGVDQDFIEAHKWANIAAANGSDDAAAQRDVLASLMTPEQVAQAQDRARAYMRGN